MNRLEAHLLLTTCRWGLRHGGLPVVWDGLLHTPVRARGLDVWVVARRLEATAGRDECLPCALAMAFTLRREGLPFELHVGVRNAPFGAHAWVDSSDGVLVGGAERAGFTTLWVGHG